MTYTFAICKPEIIENKSDDAKNKSDGGGNGLVFADVGLDGGSDGLVFANVGLVGGSYGLVFANIRLNTWGSRLIKTADLSPPVPIACQCGISGPRVQVPTIHNSVYSQFCGIRSPVRTFALQTNCPGKTVRCAYDLKFADRHHFRGLR